MSADDPKLDWELSTLLTPLNMALILPRTMIPTINNDNCLESDTACSGGMVDVREGNKVNSHCTATSIGESPDWDDGDRREGIDMTTIA